MNKTGILPLDKNSRSIPDSKGFLKEFPRDDTVMIYPTGIRLISREGYNKKSVHDIFSFSL